MGRAPSAEAVVEAGSGRRWTREALARAAGELAGSFPSGMAGRRVALAVPNSAEWFSVFLALLSVGAIPVPVDPSEPQEAQAASALFAGASFIWRAGCLHGLPATRRPFPRQGYCVVKLTSGSSGLPKGLPVTHAQLAADARQICATMGIGPDDSNLAAIPLGYSYGLGNLVGPLLLQGSRVVCLSSVLPHAVAAEVKRHGATVFPAVPPILRALVESDVPRRALAGLRLVISAGSRLAPEVSRAFAEKFGVRVHAFYGTSETGGISFDRTGAATLDGRSVGVPLEGVRVTTARGGRLRVEGAAVLGRGIHTPADRAGLNPAGEIVLLGRTDRVVKVAGRRLDLAEVEAALRAVPGVREAFAHATGNGDGPLCAAVATELAPAEVRRLLRQRIASWKLPGRILALGALPVTARGKTDTRALRQLLGAPRTATSISTLSSDRQMPAQR